MVGTLIAPPIEGESRIHRVKMECAQWKKVKQYLMETHAKKQIRT